MAASVARHVRGIVSPKRFMMCRLNSAVKVQSYNCCRHFCVSKGLLSERRYTKKHEWVLEKDKVGTIGITNYAQDALGDVVFAQLPEPGTVLKALDECGTLESVKAASEIYCPVSGIVVEKNKAVEDKPALINTSCYDEGWLFKLELSDPKELDALMNEEQYSKFVTSQS